MLILMYNGNCINVTEGYTMPSKGDRRQQVARQNRGHRHVNYLDPSQAMSECRVVKAADPELLEKNKEIIEQHNRDALRRRWGTVSRGRSAK